MRLSFTFLSTILATAQCASVPSNEDETLGIRPRQGGNPNNIMMFSCNNIPGWSLMTNEVPELTND